MTMQHRYDPQPTQEAIAMTIRTRLTTILLTCGLVPMVSVSLLSYQISSRGAANLTEQAAKSLEERASEQLRAVAIARRSDIVHYFENIGAQLASMAKQTARVDAVPRLTAALDELGNVPDAELAAARRELSRYYDQDFEGDYRRQAPGTSSGIGVALQQQDATAILAQLAWVQRNPSALGKKFELVDTKDGSAYAAEHAALHPGMVGVQQAFGYYDVFVIDAEGRVVYTVFKELDFATSLAGA
jgi:methyl-accepting chemotaxis protein